MPPKTAHDLAASWAWMARHSGFRVNGRGVVWECAEYIDERLRIGRVLPDTRTVVRYVSPDTPVVLIER